MTNMSNVPDREVKTKHRKAKIRRTRKIHESLSNAKKKTLEALYRLGRLPKFLKSRLGT